MMGNQQNVRHKKEEKMNLLHFLCMNVFDQLCVHKILRLTQIPRLQKNIVTWVVKQYIMIACRYSNFSSHQKMLL